MPGPSPAARPRMSGGFNPGMGFGDEHLAENAMQGAMQQKALSQQTAAAGNAAVPGLSGSDPVGAGGMMPSGMPGQLGAQTPPPPPRELGTIPEELVKRPLQDIAKGLLSIFDLNSMLGLLHQEDDPQTAAHKKQMLQRFNNLTEEQQAVAKKKYQESMQKKQAEEQEKQAKKQQEEQKKHQSISVPSSPKKGPQGPGGTGKQKAVNKLEHDRKTLSGPKSAN